MKSGLQVFLTDSDAGEETSNYMELGKVKLGPLNWERHLRTPKVIVKPVLSALELDRLLVRLLRSGQALLAAV